jgi:DNA-3-methyladenine glycosylase I
MEFDFKAIFSKVEKSLKAYSNLSDEEFEAIFFEFREKKFQVRSDDEYFKIIRDITFYSGFKAETVTNKKQMIEKHLPTFLQIADYTKPEIESILSDANMIKNPRKIEATIHNAQVFRRLVEQHGSFQKYLESFNPTLSFENLILLKEDLEFRFGYLGGITSYHFLTDIGLNVLKPDRVLTRIFKRLGLIEDESLLFKTISRGREFAAATGYSIRYIDIVFVKYGQQGNDEVLKIKDGICLESNPKCHLCEVRDDCNFTDQS